MVNQISREAALDQALDPGFALDNGEAFGMTSNSDEKVVIYSMLDGTSREVLKIDARRVLQKTVGGKPAFWIEGMPGQPPKVSVGTIMCLLHPEFKDDALGVDRAWVDSLGLSGRNCNMMQPDRPSRADFKGVFDRDDHMTHRHRREWEVIRAGLARRETESAKGNDEAFRQALLALANKK